MKKPEETTPETTPENRISEATPTCDCAPAPHVDGGPLHHDFLCPVTCGVYLGDNDGTCPQLTCVRRKGHAGAHDNVRGDDNLRTNEATPLTGAQLAAKHGMRPHGLNPWRAWAIPEDEKTP